MLPFLAEVLNLPIWGFQQATGCRFCHCAAVCPVGCTLTQWLFYSSRLMPTKRKPPTLVLLSKLDKSSMNIIVTVVVCLHVGSTVWFLTTDVFSFFFSFCHLKSLLLFLTSAIQEVTSACSSLMFTKIFLLIFGFNTDSPSVACCAFVCSDYSLLDLHLIATLYYFPFWCSDVKNSYCLIRLGLHLVSSRWIQTYSRGVCNRGWSWVIYAWSSLVFLFCSCIWMWNVFTNRRRFLSEVWQLL